MFLFLIESLSQCVSEVAVSINRLQQFLELPEVDETTGSCLDDSTSRTTGPNTMTNATVGTKQSEAGFYGRPPIDDIPLVSIRGVSSYWEMDLPKRFKHLEIIVPTSSPEEDRQSYLPENLPHSFGSRLRALVADTSET